MQREKEFAKNSAVLSIGTVVPKIISVVSLPIVTGALTKAEFGTFDLITVLVSLFLPITTLQIQTAAFRFLVGVRGNREEETRIISNIVFFLIPSEVLSLLILSWFMGKIQVVTRTLILLYFFLDTLLITARQIVRGLARNLTYSVSSLIHAVLELVGIYVLLRVKGEGLNGAVIAIIIAEAFSLAYILISTKLYRHLDIRAVDAGEIQKLLGYSWPMIPNALSSWVVRASDRLILALLLGVEATAVYAAANKLPNMVNLIQNTFAMAWQENAAISVNDQDSGKYYGDMFDKLFNLLVGVMALFIAFTPIGFRHLIHGDYSEAYNHIMIIYIAEVFTAISAFLGGIYIAHMKSKQIGVTTTIAAAMNCVINVVLVRRIGIYAASLSTLISYLWLSVHRMIDIQNIQKISFHYSRIAVLTSILAIMAFFGHFRNSYFDLLNMLLAIVLSIYLNRAVIRVFIIKIQRMKNG